MTDIAEIIGGADTHRDTIHVAVISATGQPRDDREFPTTEAGYRAAIEFLGHHGAPRVVGVEGTSSYGAGFTRALAATGIPVVEVCRPDRAARRCRGKTDTLDAYAAARAALSGHGVSEPKDERTGAVRALLNARRSAVKARTASINQLKALLVSAPESLRGRLRGLSTRDLVTEVTRRRPSTHADPTIAGTLTAAKALADRIVFLDQQIAALTAELDELTSMLCPALRSAYGVGPDTAAQLLVTAGDNPQRLKGEGSFAALCGVAPVPVSSGRTSRHRLSRGGDRAANNALERVPSSGAGSVVSRRVVDRTPTDRRGGLVPLTIAIVALDEGPWVYISLEGEIPRSPNGAVRVRFQPHPWEDRFPVFAVSADPRARHIGP
ncbi:IS110 family transposase [Streptomyces gardneri]|nr:IS110 family transposase [Streptomyces gardneri]